MQTAPVRLVVDGKEITKGPMVTWYWDMLGHTLIVQLDNVGYPEGALPEFVDLDSVMRSWRTA